MGLPPAEFYLRLQAECERMQQEQGGPLDTVRRGNGYVRSIVDDEASLALTYLRDRDDDDA